MARQRQRHQRLRRKLHHHPGRHQIYRVHREGMRREASILDLDRFTRVAAVLHQRYGWRVGG